MQSKETLFSRALFGDFDFLGERSSMRELPQIAKKAQSGRIKYYFYPKHTLQVTFFLNLTYEDETWRTVVRDRRFRRALGLGINRREIIKNFYLGKFAELPRKIASSEHDPAAANRLLDEMGMSKRDQDGWRLGPDGSRFTVPIEVSDFQEDYIPMGQLLAEYWKNVGVYTTVKEIDNTVRGQRAAENTLQASAAPLAYPIWPGAAWTDYLPGTLFGPLWQQWYSTQGADGEEPPREVKELFGLHGDLMSVRAGSAKSAEALDRIIRNHYDNTWYFCMVERHYAPTFWTSRIKNVPRGGPNQRLFPEHETFGIISTYGMEQWYIDESA